MPTNRGYSLTNVSRRLFGNFLAGPHIRKLEKAVAVRNSLLERSSGKFQRCLKIILRFSGSLKCYSCQGLGTFRQGKRLLENWPRLRERCWIFSFETATAFLSSSDHNRARPRKCKRGTDQENLGRKRENLKKEKQGQPPSPQIDFCAFS